MSNPMALLRKIDFFKDLDEKTLGRIAQACVERHYSKGDSIVKQGEPGLGLYFITAGRAKVEIERDGHTAEAAILQAEDFLGELSIIDDRPRPAGIVCIEDTECLLLSRESFSKIMNKYPSVAVHVAKALTARVRVANERLGQPRPNSRAADAAPDEARRPEVSGEAASGKRSGHTSSRQENSPGSKAKDQVKEFLVNSFSSLYTMKALTRFSAALIGCPVDVRIQKPGPEAFQDVVEGIKVAIFPADEGQVLSIEAYGEGSFSATVLRPSASPERREIASFATPVRCSEKMLLHIPSGRPPWIQRA